MSRLRMLCLGATACLVLATAAPSTSHAALPASNPFAQPSTLPFQAPPFDRIKDSDYQPALEEGMRQQIAEIEAIADSPEQPTFENTIAAMEKSGRLLDRVELAFFGVVQANTDDTLDKVQTDEAPTLAAHQDAIFLNPKLFARVKAIYQSPDAQKLDPESRQLLKIYYMQFVHSGALLDDADKAKLRDFNKRDAMLETAFQQKLVAAAKAGALVVDDKSALAGMSGQEIAAAGEAAKARKLDGKFVVPLQNTTQQPALTDLTDRSVREKLFDNSWTRAEKGDANDTRDIVADLAQLRAQKAKLLGYPNYAAYVLYDQMADTPDKVLNFMAQLRGPVAAKSAQEAKDIQAAID
ncbi:MAG: M3 family metallopeptidase, partial [Rhizomicrobium sp.]